MQAEPKSPTPIRTTAEVLGNNPLPLSAYQEGQVRDLYYARVRGMCAEEIKRFAECARNRTVSATWACRAQRRGMNTCMVFHATPEQHDAARDEWFRRKLEKRRLAGKEPPGEDPGTKVVEAIKGSKREGPVPPEKMAGFQRELGVEKTK